MSAFGHSISTIVTVYSKCLPLLVMHPQQACLCTKLNNYWSYFGLLRKLWGSSYISWPNNKNELLLKTQAVIFESFDVSFCTLYLARTFGLIYATFLKSRCSSFCRVFFFLCHFLGKNHRVIAIHPPLATLLHVQNVQCPFEILIYSWSAEWDPPDSTILVLEVLCLCIACATWSGRKIIN